MDLIKVIFLGASGVGKTCIVQYAVSNMYDDFSSPTIGAANTTISVKNSKGISVKFALMDTAGQEKYRSLVPIYFRNAQVAILVYDISDLRTLDDLNEFHEILRSNAPPNIITILVGAKCDLEDKREVPFEQGQRYAKDINAQLFVETSAKNGIGIKELMRTIADDERLIREDENDILNRFQIGSDIPKRKCC
ncbi:small GTP-binding protein, putative [Trichomonas vaginalis G3]|uniref:Small GTP-binding protein, putative n=1 Tax=Trichomonas vaginalis (strain ATCC PRA-98 / G3) TaxID=412133 RepID=A2DWQ3_TRIV3|nr:GTPase protein [Trichomonas vaginalis G3]EAY15238.1 small GTP-binding protein, putative [Trichomonas vaginalis G3]KAI5550602.1 GTPase protein [Trichomonas vaginalis G3]|eukprot:XP_001327461.1 small GTP-binding protein [Trichomonas vaginalis G3]